MKVWKPKSAYAATLDGDWTPLMERAESCMTVDDVWRLWQTFVTQEHRDYPEVWSLAFREVCEARAEHLLAGEHHAELDEAFRATMEASRD